jgi:hypothetical protein
MTALLVNLSLAHCVASSVSEEFAMFSSRDAYDSDRCPVRDELLGEMYRASEHGLASLMQSVTADVRAELALFCYRRSHLHSLALAIAVSCSQRELVERGGRAGASLYAESRAPVSQPEPSIPGRKPITLSTKPLASFAPLDDELDADEEQLQALSA